MALTTSTSSHPPCALLLIVLLPTHVPVHHATRALAIEYRRRLSHAHATSVPPVPTARQPSVHVTVVLVSMEEHAVHLMTAQLTRAHVPPASLARLVQASLTHATTRSVPMEASVPVYHQRRIRARALLVSLANSATVPSTHVTVPLVSTVDHVPSSQLRRLLASVMLVIPAPIALLKLTRATVTHVPAVQHATNSHQPPSHAHVLMDTLELPVAHR